MFGAAFSGNWKKLPARQVLHWFRADRPGQLRGVSELASALNNGAIRRRLTTATLLNAETAANIAGLLETESASAAADDEPGGKPFDKIPVDRNMMMTMPNGYKFKAFKGEQPTTGYDTFNNSIQNENARCINVPFNVAMGNSSGYNYSSGRLDYQGYDKSLSIERTDLEDMVEDRVLAAFLEEAVMIPGLLPAGLDINELPHRWFYDGRGFIDPVKEAQAATILIDANLMSRSEYCEANGKDVEDVFREIAAEKAMMADLDITPMPTTGQKTTQQPQDQPQEDTANA